MKPTSLVSFLSGAITFASVLNAGAAVNLVQNGGFESIFPTVPGNGQMGYNLNATSWTTTGYNILFSSGSADTTGAPSFNGTVKLWGPNDGSPNGLPASSPDGGNFVAADAADDVGAIQQTISGLTVGQHYALLFYWGGVEELPDHVATTEKWTVSLGTESHSTTMLNVPAYGFSGWSSQFFSYTATSTSEVLSFLASGNPSGQPPFALLDGVSLTAIPETSTVLAGASTLLLLGAGGARRLRRKTPREGK